MNAQDLKAIAELNIESLRAYGSGSIKLTRDPDGRRCFTLKNDKFRLTDEFDGGSPFCGIVRIIRRSDGAVVWNSYYHGWLTEKAAAHGLSPEVVFNFMRQALQHPEPGTISRGPALYEDGDLRYANTLESGDITCFYGQEVIFYDGEPEPVYTCRYGGGLVSLSEDMGEAL